MAKPVETRWQVRLGKEQTDVVYEPPSAEPLRGIHVLAHGAGGNMETRNLLREANILRSLGLGVVRFNFFYRSAHRSYPDKMPQLIECYSTVVDSIAASVQSAGATTVSAHTLFDIARKLPEGSQVEISVAGDKMAIAAGRARFNLATLPRDDFPMIAESDLPTKFALPAETLRQIIDKTRFAISTEETRYYLNGIFMHFHEDDIRAVATDGHRLAMAATRQPDSVEEGMALSAIEIGRAHV